MIESHVFQPCWPDFYHHHNNNKNMNVHSILDNVVRYDGFRMDDDTSYSLSTVWDDYSPGLFSSHDIDAIILQDRFPIAPDHLGDHDESMDITTEDVLLYFKDAVSNVVPEISTTDASMSLISSDTSLDVTSMLMPAPSPSSLVFPSEDMEINNEMFVFHLLMAYAEAMELGQKELAEVVAKRISQKVSPIGDTVERLMYYMFQTSHNQSDYLKQESLKNFHQAFKAFYQTFPYGKFAHFVANLAILESLPSDVDVIVIFDFDIGEGIQWASLIEAIGRNHGQVEVQLTSVKFISEEEEQEEEEHSHNIASPLAMWKFEDTKKRLCDYASSYGLKLKVDEMEWDDDLVDEINTNKPKLASSSTTAAIGRREFYVFNCMVGLPHMGRMRSRRDVFSFLRVSQTFLQHRGGSHRHKKGIITFGDGDAWDKVRNASNYTSFLDENMTHYQALLESIKLNFPGHLGDARTAMECLFVQPLVACNAWAEKWEDRKKYGQLEDSSRFGLECFSLSRESLLEAKEVARESESLYRVRIEGESRNEMIMEWRGIPMIKVCCWRS